MKTHLYAVLFLLAISITCAGQEKLKKNNISIAPLTFVDRTINFSYSRYINENWNYTIYPRVRIRKSDGTTIEMGAFQPGMPHQPNIYSRTYIRTGFQFHHRWIYAEPLVQLDYGWIRDEWLEVDEEEGGIYELQDRSYYSAGIVTVAGIYLNSDIVRVRFYAGLGGHVKYFEVDARDCWADLEEFENCSYHDEYYKLMYSIHLGFEIGFNF